MCQTASSQWHHPAPLVHQVSPTLHRLYSNDAYTCTFMADIKQSVAPPKTTSPSGQPYTPPTAPLMKVIQVPPWHQKESRQLLQGSGVRDSKQSVAPPDTTSPSGQPYTPPIAPLMTLIEVPPWHQIESPHLLQDSGVRDNKQ